MAACTAIIAVAALSTMGGGASGESNALVAAISRATATLTGRDSGATSNAAHAEPGQVGARSLHARVEADPRPDSMSSDESDLRGSEAQGRDADRHDPRRGPPGTLEMELSVLHDHHGITALPDLGPLIDPDLVRLASDYNNPLRPGQELYPRPSRQLEEKARAKSEPVEGPAGLEDGAVAATTETCDSKQFSSVSGSELVSSIKAASLDCLDTLHSLTGTDAGATFAESKMITVANAITSHSAGYDGTNSNGILNLMYFMRAGYYVQYYQKSAVGEYGTSLTAAIRNALDKFSANTNFKKVDDANGEVLESYFILVIGSDSVTYKLPVFKDMYARYDNSWNNYNWMRLALDRTLIALSKKNKIGSELGQYVQTDTSIITSLYNLVDRNFLVLYSKHYYVIMSAVGEMTRFMQHGGAAEAAASSRVKNLLAKSSPINGSVTAGVWMRLAEAVSSYDAANCSAYGTCNYKESVMADVFPDTHVCSSTLKIRAQSMLASELSATCAELSGQESFFHSKLMTNKVPVADDNTSSLEVFAFNSKFMYDAYGHALFGIDTNNGGKYLEGKPAAVGNQAKFIAHEAQWERAKFSIWNLNHEYVHYLDGRFNTYGDYALGQTAKTRWWIEGLAEYVSYEYMKIGAHQAIAQARLATYPISTIFKNDKNSGQTRTYQWGYLAVRYMFEKRPGKVSSILSYLRSAPDYSDYAGYMNDIGTSLDVDFKNWLACVGNVGAQGCPMNKPPTADFKSIISGLTVQFADYSKDVDGSIASQTWSFSDGATVTGLFPVKRFSAPGTYDVTLKVVDDKGAESIVRDSVTVAEFPTCSDPDARRLGQSCKRTASTVLYGGTYRAAFYVTVPVGIKQLRITLGGGTGEADLYVLGPSSVNPAPVTWADQTWNMYRSIQPGNGESILIDRPIPGVHTLAVYSKGGVASGMTISSQFVTN
ncbi:collagenase [Lysobacter firmicutimachus]|uniref:microbial collagenase n=1 Tax=Lysobacter firmicutimachus TaxID=1792846 RepID=A0ABU8D567_9GAMM